MTKIIKNGYCYGRSISDIWEKVNEHTLSKEYIKVHQDCFINNCSISVIGFLNLEEFVWDPKDGLF